VLRVIREILFFKPKAKATNFPKVLEFLTKVLAADQQFLLFPTF